MDEFKIIPINVGHGESILVCINHNDRKFNLLVDGGSYCKSTDAYNKPVFHVENIKRIAQTTDLHGLVVSHVDDDHIGGIIHIIREWKKLDQERNFFLIFNDYIDHSISFSQGEVLIDEIEQLQKNQNINIRILNTYSKRYISANRWIQKYLYTLPIQVLSIFQRKMLPEKRSDYIYLTLLTPGKKEINSLMQEWKKYKIGKQKGKKTSANGKIINDSSISLLLEYDGHTILFTGDSSIELIRHKLNELSKVINHIDYINLCHHGAAENNRGILELLEEYKCGNVFASTNSVRYPEHPSLFMLYKIIRNSGTKIYLTNELLCLGQRPKWNLVNSKVFSGGPNVEGNINTIVQNLEAMEFPPDQQNLEKFVEGMKDKLVVNSSGKIIMDVDKLIEAFCAQIKDELEKAIGDGKIICKQEYIAI